MRTNDTAVRKVIELDATLDTAPHIETANALVTEVCVPAAYVDARLELIERWLAAHFCAIRQQIVASESAGPVSANYQYKLGLMFQSTMWGQQALMLDTAGGLARLSKAAETGSSRRVSIIWLGSDCSASSPDLSNYGW